MALNTEQFYLDTFTGNVELLAQRAGSGLPGKTLMEAAQGTGNRKFIRQYGASSFTLVTNRSTHVDASETPKQNTVLSWQKYEHTQLFDSDDEMRQQLTEPNSQLLQSVVNASEALYDDTFFDNILGNATRGSTVDSSLTTTANSNSIATTYHEDAGVTASDFHNGKLRRAAAILDAGFVSKMDRYFAFASRQLQIMRSDSTVLSSDFNRAPAPMQSGEVGPMLYGFGLVNSEAVNKSGNNRSCVAWQKSGAVMADSGLETHLDVDFTAGHSKRLSVYRRVGCTRLEEAKVVEVLCDESAVFGA